LQGRTGWCTFRPAWNAHYNQGENAMATVMPKNELARKAVEYVNEERKDTDKPLMKIVEEASVRFNLGPKDAEYLTNFFKEEQD
jgi:hypothetical protein